MFSLVAQIKEAYENKRLVWAILSRFILTRYNPAILGLFWVSIKFFAIATPIAFASHYFHNRGTDISNIHLASTILGFLAFYFFQSILTESTNFVLENQNLYVKVYIPKLIFPIAVVLYVLLELLLFLSIILLASVYLEEMNLGILIKNLAYSLPLLAIVGVGLSMLCMTLSALFHDFRHLILLITQLGLFATPVLYPFSDLKPILQSILMFNPAAIFVLGFQTLTLPSQLDWLPAGHWSIGITANFLLFVVGTYTYIKKSKTFSDYL